MNTAIQNTEEFLKNIPKTMTIDGDKIIISDTIKNSEITVSQGANLHFIAFLEKGWEEKQTLNFKLEGKNSSVTFIGLILGSDEEQFPFETISTHTSKNTRAKYLIRGAMFDSSGVNYKGNLKIEKQAEQTDSYLAHHTLMLSDKASTNTIPSLEIEADDVKAGHAATVGKVDDNTLYYLQSRGLGKRAATDILIKGFMETDLSKIPNTEIRDLLAKEIENSLEKLI